MDSKLLNSGTPHRAAGSPYLCRCRWWRRGWRRSCTPAPWCGRRAASGCSPRSAAWRRPCSSRSRPAPAPRPGRTAARRPGTGRRRGTESREPAGRAERSGERRHRRAVIPCPPPVKPRGRHLPGGPGRAGRPPARGELPQSPCLSGACSSELRGLREINVSRKRSSPVGREYERHPRLISPEWVSHSPRYSFSPWDGRTAALRCAPFTFGNAPEQGRRLEQGRAALHPRASTCDWHCPALPCRARRVSSSSAFGQVLDSPATCPVRHREQR